MGEFGVLDGAGGTIARDVGFLVFTSTLELFFLELVVWFLTVIVVSGEIVYAENIASLPMEQAKDASMFLLLMRILLLLRQFLLVLLLRLFNFLLMGLLGLLGFM